MNGERPTVNGEHVPNGVPHSVPHHSSDSTLDAGGVTQERSRYDGSGSASEGTAAPYANGARLEDAPQKAMDQQHMANGLDQAPLEVLQLITQDAYLPMAALISRAAQMCWNSLSSLVDDLATISVPDQTSDQNRPSSAPPLMAGNYGNNTTKQNLDKKERLLTFANERKADFIKLLVLLQWSKDVEAVTKTIQLNFWLMLRREAFWKAISEMALLKQDATNFQIPNPDLTTAAQVLSLGRVASFPDLGYRPRPKLSSKQMLRTLKTLNHLLSVRMSLHEELVPPPLQRFSIANGRVTFRVADEFDLDISILDDDHDDDNDKTPPSPFRVVDFRFNFSPAPVIPDQLHDEIANIANGAIDRAGLAGCYDFLHELTLSFKLSELYRQARELARGQWAGHLRVELIRRTLVVQYWCERPMGKNWIEMGIHSGRREDGDDTTQGPTPPFLDVRWMQQAKPVEHFDAVVDPSRLCFEDVLRQVIAQHSNHILDVVYDKLMTTPLFADAVLPLEQASSTVDPDESCLRLGVSQTRPLQVKLEPVTGAVLISPVSERSERLQLELNRSKNLVEDFPGKLLNFRCAVAEADVLDRVSCTTWEILRTFRPSPNDVKAWIGASVVKTNFFRQPFWGPEYSVAITHGAAGDHWWLFQHALADGTAHQARCQLIRTQPVHGQDELSPAYFERFAEYTSGFIVLQRNAQYLIEAQQNFDLPALPPFDRGYVLPDLSFELDVARARRVGWAQKMDGHGAQHMSTDDASPPLAAKASARRTVRMSFAGIDPSTKLSTVTARLQSEASVAVLKYLEKSGLDDHVLLNPRTKEVAMRVEAVVGEPAIPEIIDRVLYLEDIIACVERIQNIPSLALRSLSRSAITIVYHQTPSTELALSIKFATATTPLRLEFLPPGQNPHTIMTSQLIRVLSDRRLTFATKLSNLLSSLSLTYPLVSFLHRLQEAPSPTALPPETASSQNEKSNCWVHVLVRRPTMFALQYFTSATQVPCDVQGPETTHLLARFEILPHVPSTGKILWLVRPAIEEFKSYLRPSYSSQDLRSKMRQEIFARSDGQHKWLSLDTAAACLVHEPEPLLQAIHDLLLKWVHDAVHSAADESVKADTEQKTEGKNALPNGSGPARPPAKSQKPAPVHTGGTNSQRTKPHATTTATNTTTTTTTKAVPQPRTTQEVITLD